MGRFTVRKLVVFARDQQHLGRGASQRPGLPVVECLLDDKSGIAAELREAGRGVQADAMNALAAARESLPLRFDGQESAERVERPLLRDDRPIACAPPIARQETRRDAIAAGSVPHQHAARRQDAREFPDDAFVVARVGEEAEGREQVDDGVESPGPGPRQASHVAAPVTQVAAHTATRRGFQQLRRVIETVDVVAGLGQQVRVAPLAAGTVENASADREREDLDEARDLTTIANQIEQRLVLEEIGLVEVRAPPLPGQKKTGSR